MPNDLYYINVDIELHAPVLMGGSVGDENMVTTEDYISGSAVLGTLASQYLAGKTINENDPGFADFQKFFLSGRLQFLNGYPVNESDERLLPIPRSIQFGKDEKAKPVDLLLQDEDSAQNKKDETQAEQTKYKSGFCSLVNYFFQNHKVAKQFQIHHQRSNVRVGRSAEGEIFNYESILPRQTFRSILLGEEKVLQDFLALFPTSQIRARLGRSRQTQYGGATITIGNSPKQFSRENEFYIPERYQDLLDKEKVERWREAHPEKIKLTFLSDVILIDDHGENRVDMEVLAQTLGLQKGNIKKSFTRSRIVENYVSAWQARTPSYVAFEKGSCFLIDKADAAKMTNLEKTGIGLKCNEGYGRIAVNWQLGKLLIPDSDDDKKTDEDLKAVQEEKISIESVTAPLVMELARQKMLDNVQHAASEKVHEIAENKLFAKFCTKIKSTQIQKLRRFATSCNTHDEFKQKLNTMPKTSRTNLEEAKYHGETFWDFLTTDPTTHFGRILSEDSDLKKLSTLDVLENNDFKKRMMKHYYASFFTLLAKRAKEVNNG